MSAEDSQLIIQGDPPLAPLPKGSFGVLIYEQLIRNVNRPEAAVDAVTGEKITYEEILNLSCRLAETLQKHGYGLNRILGVCSENSLQFFIPIISCLYIGAIITSFNPTYTTEELKHCLNLTQPEILFCSKATYKKFLHLKRDHIKKIIVIDTNENLKEKNVETLSSFICNSENLSYQQYRPLELDGEQQTAFILYSSGTTGLPKGVMLTHTNIMVRYMHTIDPRYTRKQQSLIGVLPFFHAYGLVSNLVGITIGQRIVVMKHFDLDVFLKSIQTYRITTLWIVPPIAVLLAKHPAVKKYDLSSIEEILCGSAPLSKNVEDRIKERLKIKYIRQGYGLTETTFAVLLVPRDQHRSGSCGKVVSYMAVVVRDPETGALLGPHQAGELCCKGPYLMKGYYNNPEATRNTVTRDGWLLTGDVAYYDDDNYFYIVDRFKELIKYKGYQVPPAELEAILLQHPKIADAGVIGVPNDEVGELPLGFIVKRSNVELSEKEVEDFVASRVAPFKRLRGGVIFIKQIPKSPSGKILRRELRQLLKQHLSKM